MNLRNGSELGMEMGDVCASMKCSLTVNSTSNSNAESERGGVPGSREISKAYAKTKRAVLHGSIALCGDFSGYDQNARSGVDAPPYSCRKYQSTLSLLILDLDSI
jgi:hypothetical protein